MWNEQLIKTIYLGEKYTIDWLFKKQNIIIDFLYKWMYVIQLRLTINYIAKKTELQYYKRSLIKFFSKETYNPNW